MLKNELIFDTPMLCLYALWFRIYFNDIEKICFKKFNNNNNNNNSNTNFRFLICWDAIAKENVRLVRVPVLIME